MDQIYSIKKIISEGALQLLLVSWYSVILHRGLYPLLNTETNQLFGSFPFWYENNILGGVHTREIDAIFLLSYEFSVENEILPNMK